MIDALAARGVLFEQAFSPAPLTLPAHATLLTGLDPPRHSVRDNAVYRLPERAETLAELLREHGYRTFAAVGSVILDARFGLAQGFAAYDQAGLSTASRQGTTDRPADAVAAAALAQLEGAEPFFGFVHFYDPHQPFTPPPDLARTLAGSDPRDLYYAEIAAADRALGRLLEALETQGRRERTLVVVTADHGEGRGEHGEITHGMLLHDATQRVPLLFAHPRLAPRRLAAPLATLADVLPTVLDFAGLGVPPALDGRSLLPALRDEAVAESRSAYLETLSPFLSYDFAPLEGVRTLQWKLVRGGRVRLFDVAADPGEREDLAGARPEVTAALGRELDRLRARGPTLEEDVLQISGAELAVLGGLGYVTATARAADPARSLPDPYEALPAVDELQRALALLGERPADALPILESLVDRHPGTLLFRQNLGTCYGRLGRHAEALREFEAALVLHPASVDLRVNAGVAAAQCGALAEAAAHLRQALGAPACPPRAFFQLYQVLQQDGRPAEAQAVLQDLLARPDVPEDARREARRVLGQAPVPSSGRAPEDS